METGLEIYCNRLKRKLAVLVRSRHRELIAYKVDARQGYRFWASSYADETAISYLEDQLAQEMLHGLPRNRLLDAGCGMGRRIAEIAGAIGMDDSPEMIAAANSRDLVARDFVVGDVRAMPFTSSRFNMVWCRLVLGHVHDPMLAYHELARVCAPGGYVFVSDFHPEAAAAGHQRTFTDQSGRVCEIEHYAHTNHSQLAADAGLSLVGRQEGIVGPSIRDFYIRGIGLKAYKRDAGLKLVAAFLFRKSGQTPPAASPTA